ncbi:hypothetical protein HBI88_147740 [Parastagonospora nodorum]|nr:hypothetical protein HBH95_050220 [Parastagonospora nodorum]KAH5765969.1 hypothetical protein HBI97_172600 [Parastagonospora nodorum]KAH5769155.1 hypothetical protein HBI17_020630 [Parastagonospora nodorum]KAH5797556.1 hypothetical protein HBI96_165490 [Parastagonospora nodorum]KAH5812131.1 hypothetical protein HBI94_147200 [Parastagonospora nodorum]
MLKTFFPMRIPKASVVGISMTMEQATELHSITNLLVTIIYQQFYAIEAFNRFTKHGLSPHLNEVQQRQSRFQTRLSDLIKATKDSSQPWLRELMDGQEAILRKIRQCNHMAQHSLGWKDSAIMYWPHISDSYEILRPVLERLHQELGGAIENGQLWAPKTRTDAVSKVQARRHSMVYWFGQTRRLALVAAPRASHKTVRFDKEVQARWMDAREEPEKTKDARKLTLQLTTDKKNTAKLKKFQARRTSLQQRKKDGKSESESELESEPESEVEVQESVMQEVEDEDAITPIPY